MNIILATAHTDLRLALELLLSEEPGVHIVGTVSESDGLLALIQITQPAIVISDWNLPGRPLPEIMQATNQLTNQPEFIILMTRFDSDHIALEAGAYAVAYKGDPPELLLNTFRELRATNA